VTTMQMTVGEHTIELDDDPASFTAAEVSAVERVTGWTLSEWGQKIESAAVGNISVTAWGALAWIGLRRAGTFLPWDEFMNDLSVVDLVQSLRPVAGDAPAGLVPNRAERRRAGGKAGAA
jgi:hypothetical protein